MAEQSLNELVLNLISWIESLHEKNLKYEAQVQTLSRDLAQAKEELEARLPNLHPQTDLQQQPQAQPQQSIPQHHQIQHHHPIHHQPHQIHQPPPPPPPPPYQIHQLHEQELTQVQQQPLPPPPPQAIYQPAPQVFAQPSSYHSVWTTYDTSGQVTYYDQ